MYPQIGLGRCNTADERTETDPAYYTGTFFHLPVGGLPKRLLRAVPNRVKRIEQSGFTSFPGGAWNNCRKTHKHVLWRSLQESVFSIVFLCSSHILCCRESRHERLETGNFRTAP